MMGLQSTSGKRKLEAATAPGDSSPPKTGRWDSDDCIARLQAVAVPGDTWRPAPAPATPAYDDFEPEPAPRARRDPWQHYQPPQQTIRRENGKSYLELGAAPARWCHAPCYRQRRLAVLNLSMCKLARYRQCADPSLRRSVLICNTLRRLERELEAEPPEPSVAPPPEPFEPGLRQLAGESGRATPFPAADCDSGLGDEDERPINWGSVLSLTSQGLNGSELYAGLGDGEWREEPARDEWGDGFMHVMVGGT